MNPTKTLSFFSNVLCKFTMYSTKKKMSITLKSLTQINSNDGLNFKSNHSKLKTIEVTVATVPLILRHGAWDIVEAPHEHVLGCSVPGTFGVNISCKSSIHPRRSPILTDKEPGVHTVLVIHPGLHHRDGIHTQASLTAKSMTSLIFLIPLTVTNV